MTAETWSPGRTATSMRRLIVAGMALVAAAGVAGCGHDNGTGRLFRAGSISASRIDSAVSYDHGMIRFDPAADSQWPTVSAQDAYQLGASSGWYAGAPAGEQPTIEFGLYTNYGHGTASADGKIEPAFVDVPVWIVLFADVPTDGAGGAHVAGQTSSAAPPALEDLISIVDATTGKSISLMNDAPDATVQMTPPVAG